MAATAAGKGAPAPHSSSEAMQRPRPGARPLDLNPSLATCQLCDLRYLAQPLCASLSRSETRGWTVVLQVSGGPPWPAGQGPAETQECAVVPLVALTHFRGSQRSKPVPQITVVGGETPTSATWQSAAIPRSACQHSPWPGLWPQVPDVPTGARQGCPVKAAFPPPPCLGSPAEQGWRWPMPSPSCLQGARSQEAAASVYWVGGGPRSGEAGGGGRGAAPGGPRVWAHSTPTPGEVRSAAVGSPCEERHCCCVPPRLASTRKARQS